MLDPYDRRHLKEILKPPEGYALDYAIGTSFSLDLVALMTAPVAFTIFEMDDDFSKADLLVLLESLRRYAGRISIFCNAGRIKIPENYSESFCLLLEGSVFQALPSNGVGAFHPKVWALRYISQNGPVAYRFLCMSRNLTYDRSWDTALVLDGFLSEPRKPIAANQPLSDFIASLPRLSLDGLPADQQKKIEQMQDEIRRVEFDLPQGFESVIFHPLGIYNKKGDPISGRIDRMLIISPFLTKGHLDHLATLGKESILVSRLDSLQKISSDCLGKFSSLFSLNDDAVLGTDDRLDGLHAKLYAADAGSEGRIWTGSANATDAAFSKNVEFLVELRGKRNLCGIDALLNGSNGTGGVKRICLRTLLEPFNNSGDVIIDGLEPLNMLANEARSALVKAGLSARVSQDDGQYFSIFIEGQIISLPKEVSVTCWPITLPEVRGVPLSYVPGVHAEFRNLLKEGISAFFAFNMTVSSDGKNLCEGFVLKLPLTGAPTDRFEHIIRNLLTDKNHVLRLMMILLTLDREPDLGEIPPGPSIMENGEKRAPGIHHGIVPLFESMVRALTRDPQRIDDLNNLIQNLKRNTETCDLLPKDLDEIWEPIWQARTKMKGAGHEEN